MSSLAISSASSGQDQSNSSAANSSQADNTERCCENNDCSVSKLVSLVPKRKTSQFVTEPHVSEKPLLINGFTTVFQLDGAAAKLSDLKNFNGSSSSSAGTKPVFRIKPNSHVHVINYVVVDDDGDALRKINESDPETMRKLLESQKKSAEMKLKRLMFGADNTAKSPAASGGVSSASKSPGAITRNTSTGSTTSGTSTPSQQPRIKVIQAASTKNKTSPGPGPGSNQTMQMPLKTHSNLKIAAVASADNLNKLPTSSSSSQTMANTSSSSPGISTPPSMPLITPVPLSSLQNVVMEKNNFDKMQSEIEELRRTVAMLAEAQAKSQPPAAASSTPPTLLNKRARLN